MQKKKTGVKEELYGALGKAFDFTKGDLEANRAGFMSYRQKSLHYMDIGCMGLAALVSFLICGIFLIAILKKKSLYEFETIDKFVLGGFCLLGLFFLTLVLMNAYVLYQNDKYGRVAKMQGQINPKSLGADRIIINNKEFRVTRKQYDFAWQTIPYVLYYLPKSEVILSIEELTPEES